MDGDLESQHGAPLRTETRRRGADFDAVVLAIPVPVHDRIAGSVRRSNPAFDAMVRNHASVVTTAAQVWSRDPLPALGWAGAPPIAVNGNQGYVLTAGHCDGMDWVVMERSVPPVTQAAWTEQRSG